MRWADYYRRRAVLDVAVRQVARDGVLSFDRVDGAAEVFSGPDELVLALHHRWSLLLQARVELGLAEAAGDAGKALVGVVSKAWLALAADEPVLRVVLDAYERDPWMGAALVGEGRMLALNAGLVHPDQPAAIISEIGAELRRSLRPGGVTVVCGHGA